MKNLALIALWVLCVSATATAASPEAVLERLFTGEEVQAEWFAPAFSSQVPPAQVRQIIMQLTSQLGPWTGVQRSGAEFLVALERGIIPARITLDASGRVAGLFFGPPRPIVRGMEEAVQPFRALSGQVSLAVIKDGVPLASLDADLPLAVGSSFKLAVLAALQEEISRGARAFEDVVHLQPEWKSLPSGTLHTWPDGAPLTLHTLAAKMISASDNTATDALIHVLGRASVERFGVRNAPFLTTREAFALKNPANSAHLEAYRGADSEARRALLAETSDLPLPSESVFSGDPVALDVEWFYSVYELCALMAGVQSLPLMGINPGLASADAWSWVAYKGGSEPGVLNLTTWLVDDSGAHACVSATWNDVKPLDELRFMTLYGGLLAALRN